MYRKQVLNNQEHRKLGSFGNPKTQLPLASSANNQNIQQSNSGYKVQNRSGWNKRDAGNSVGMPSQMGRPAPAGGKLTLASTSRAPRAPATNYQQGGPSGATARPPQQHQPRAQLGPGPAQQNRQMPGPAAGNQAHPSKHQPRPSQHPRGNAGPKYPRPVNPQWQQQQQRPQGKIHGGPRGPVVSMHPHPQRRPPNSHQTQLRGVPRPSQPLRNVPMGQRPFGMKPGFSPAGLRPSASQNQHRSRLSLRKSNSDNGLVFQQNQSASTPGNRQQPRPTVIPTNVQSIPVAIGGKVTNEGEHDKSQNVTSVSHDNQSKKHSNGQLSIQELQKQVEDLNRKNSSLQRSLSHRENELQSVKQRLEKEEEKTFDNQIQIATVEAEANNRVKKVTESMESKLKFKENDLAQAQSMVSKLRAELEGFKSNSQHAYGSQRSMGRPGTSRSPRSTPRKSKRQRSRGDWSGSSGKPPATPASETPSDSERSPIASVRSKYRKSTGGESPRTSAMAQPVSPEKKGLKRPRTEESQENQAKTKLSLKPTMPKLKSVEVEVQTDEDVRDWNSGPKVQSRQQEERSEPAPVKEDLLVRVLLGNSDPHLLEVLGLYGKVNSERGSLGSLRRSDPGGTPGTPRYSQRLATPGATPSTPWSALGKSAHKEHSSSLGWAKGSMLSKEVWLSVQKLVLGQSSHISMALALLGFLESSKKLTPADLRSALHILEQLLLYSEDVRRAFIYHQRQNESESEAAEGENHFGGVEVDAVQRYQVMHNIFSGAGVGSVSVEKNCLFDQSSARLVTPLLDILDANWKDFGVVQSIFQVLSVFAYDCPIHTLGAWAPLITKKIFQKSALLHSAPAVVQGLVLDVLTRLLHHETSHKLLAGQDNRPMVSLLEQIIKLKRENKTSLQLMESSNCLKAIRILASLAEKEEPEGIKKLLAHSTETNHQDFADDHVGNSLIPILILCLKRHLQTLELFKDLKMPLSQDSKKLREISFSIVSEGYSLLPLLSEFTVEPFTSILENSGTRLALQGLDFKLLNNLVDCALEGLSLSVDKIAQILNKEQQIFFIQHTKNR